jgi:hypothetical protein
VTRFEVNVEIQVPANAFDWMENCPDCRLPMAKVLLTMERIKIEPSTINGSEPYPSWFYEWSQKPCFIAGAGAFPFPQDQARAEGDWHSAIAFPTWYCVRCITVWVVFRGLWFKTSFAPAVPAGIVNAGDSFNRRDAEQRDSHLCALAPLRF